MPPESFGHFLFTRRSFALAGTPDAAFADVEAALAELDLPLWFLPDGKDDRATIARAIRDTAGYLDSRYQQLRKLVATHDKLRYEIRQEGSKTGGLSGMHPIGEITWCEGEITVSGVLKTHPIVESILSRYEAGRGKVNRDGWTQLLARLVEVQWDGYPARDAGGVYWIPGFHGSMPEVGQLATLLERFGLLLVVSPCLSETVARTIIQDGLTADLAYLHSRPMGKGKKRTSYLRLSEKTSRLITLVSMTEGLRAASDQVYAEAAAARNPEQKQPKQKQKPPAVAAPPIEEEGPPAPAPVPEETAAAAAAATAAAATAGGSNGWTAVELEGGETLRVRLKWILQGMYAYEIEGFTSDFDWNVSPFADDVYWCRHNGLVYTTSDIR